MQLGNISIDFTQDGSPPFWYTQSVEGVFYKHWITFWTFQVIDKDANEIASGWNFLLGPISICYMTNESFWFDDGDGGQPSRIPDIKPKGTKVVGFRSRRDRQTAAEAS